MKYCCVIVISIIGLASAAFGQLPNTGDYSSLQEAIAAHPGQVVFVPQGHHEIDEPLRLTADDSGLVGYGVIVQRNKDAAILDVSGARGVRIRDLTFTRAEGAQDCDASGIVVRDCRDLLIENIRLVDNRSQRPAIDIRESVDCRIQGSEVRNYKRIAIDDRTSAEETLYGYAFFCIDGTGVMVKHSQRISLLHNRIVEDNLLPTQEMKERHQLGSLTDGQHPTNPGALGRGAVSSGYVSNWHQGSTIVVTSPETTRDILISGNYIENCAQGIDLHCDYVRCTDNTVVCGMMGVKMTHGSQHVIVANNLLTRIDLWAILYNPGAISHGGIPATDDAPARPANVDGGSIIANNIITDYGHGHEYWNWGGASPAQSGSYAIAFYDGQLPDNPPVSDVLVTGNMVYHSGDETPRYRYAFYMGTWGVNTGESPNMPRNIELHGNMFHPGSAGVSNIEIP